MKAVIPEYNAKRDFSKTKEPEGVIEKRMGRLRFVVQEHHASHLHYDFRLEMGGVLKSWAVPKGPSMDPDIKRLAVHVEDHPLSYRTFHGDIPEGEYGGGHVEIWDEGVYTSLTNPSDDESQLEKEYKNGNIKFVILGKKLQGEFHLFRLKKDDKNWILMKGKDEYSEEKNTTPHDIKPMLATLVDSPFDSKDFLFEIKWDGYRAIAEVSKGEVKLYSRSNQDFSKKYHPITVALENVEKDIIVDGEIVVMDEDGKGNFQALQNFQNNPSKNIRYVIFDVLLYDDEDVRSQPLMKRKELLKSLKFDSRYIIVSDFIEEHGKDFFKAAIKSGLEGIIAKNKQSIYQEGIRSDDWLKIKATRRQEAIICGLTEPRGTREKFGAIILGQYKNGLLTYVGHSGSGFNREDLQYIFDKLAPLHRTTSPFDIPPKTNTPVTWVEPELLCEVEFTEWTRDGIMRHPIFVGLREDKNPRNVVGEFPQATEDVLQKEEDKFTVSHPDKIYFPEDKITKQQLVDYYKSISEIILPYLKNRPESLHRHPNGIYGTDFFQKDITFHVPDFVTTTPVNEDDGDILNYIVCNNEETLLYLANLGCIEINPWSSQVDHLENPDYLIIDLDPEEIEFEKVVDVANAIRDVLEKAEIPSFPKTSGKTGIHILIPLDAQYNFDQIKKFSEILALLIHQKVPDITSLERSPSKRLKKVYIDYLQNKFAQTIAAPYSVRPVIGATVSTPLLWEEVNHKLHPSLFTIKNINKRIEKYGDIFKGILGKGISLEKTLERLGT